MLLTNSIPLTISKSNSLFVNTNTTISLSAHSIGTHLITSCSLSLMCNTSLTNLQNRKDFEE